MFRHFDPFELGSKESILMEDIELCIHFHFPISGQGLKIIDFLDYFELYRSFSFRRPSRSGLKMVDFTKNIVFFRTFDHLTTGST